MLLDHQHGAQTGMPNSSRSNRREFPDLLPPPHWVQVACRYRLTRQEAVLVQLLCRGLSNQQLCDRLAIALPTVRCHLRAIYRKMGQNSRTGIVLRVIHDLGLTRGL